MQILVVNVLVVLAVKVFPIFFLILTFLCIFRWILWFSDHSSPLSVLSEVRRHIAAVHRGAERPRRCPPRVEPNSARLESLYVYTPRVFCSHIPHVSSAVPHLRTDACSTKLDYSHTPSPP